MCINRVQLYCGIAKVIEVYKASKLPKMLLQHLSVNLIVYE